jgi:hypothetical protein
MNRRAVLRAVWNCSIGNRLAAGPTLLPNSPTSMVPVKVMHCGQPDRAAAH